MKCTVPPATYHIEIAASVHEVMEAIFRIGLIDAATMSELDKSCLAPAIQAASAQAASATRSSDP